MQIIKNLLGRRDYYSKDEIIQFINNSKHYNSHLEELGKATALLFFQTSKQKTWLVSTNKRLYCILDDNRKNKPNINWSISKQNLLDSEINTRDYSEEMGLVDIGPEKNWFYSKRLFIESDIKTSIIKEIFSLILRTTSWFMKERQEEYSQKYPEMSGYKIYNIKACIDSDVPGVLERVDRVEYHLHPSYGEKQIQTKSDYKDKFLLKELTEGRYNLIAKVFLKGKEEPIELQQYLELQKDGPHIC